MRYRSASAAFFTFAATFDPGWQAAVDAAPVTAWLTAACQIGVEPPAGEHRLVLAYRDPRVPVGAALSLAGLLAWIAALVHLRPRRHPLPEPGDRGAIA